MATSHDEACSPHRHNVLLKTSQLLEDAWSKQFIPLKVSVGAWLRLEPSLRALPLVHSQVYTWAVDSILAAARRLAETNEARAPKIVPVVAIKLLKRDAPDLSIADLMAHLRCLLNDRHESWIEEQYLSHLLSSGLFGEAGLLIKHQVDADIAAGERLRQKVWDYVSHRVSHALDEGSRVSVPLNLDELNEFLDDVGALIQKWRLVVEFSGTDDDVAHIQPEAELVEVLRMWDRQRFDAAAREFAASARSMNYRAALDWFRMHARAEFVADEPE